MPQNSQAVTRMGRLLAGALCVLMTVAILDTVPDPPALGPQPLLHNLAQIRHLEPVTNSASELTHLTWDAFIQTSRSLQLSFGEKTFPGAAFTLVQQATDASPPSRV